jgi:hypothetical protein
VFGFVLEAEHCQISPSHNLRYQEAHIDPRITDRFRTSGSCAWTVDIDLRPSAKDFKPRRSEN